MRIATVASDFTGLGGDAYVKALPIALKKLCFPT
jgi:hypothetical protein